MRPARLPTNSWWPRDCRGRRGSGKRVSQRREWTHRDMNGLGPQTSIAAPSVGYWRSAAASLSSREQRLHPTRLDVDIGRIGRHNCGRDYSAVA